MTNDDVIADVPTEKRRQIEESLAKIREGLLGLSFGSVVVTVHNDRVVQIEVTEKTRLRST
ncbi:YezD family protein [Sphingopyxis panaciterrulae]|uniref:DUF2292 domain-containing protein n=1 Tax=Sphingopyxis panaciterrulae TaxID=462372 RepID=A0A7W9B6X3_9SPHN|nr:YezD family protein [Sphingopyxis panaciterrulae]MBB5706984.1 hypothetical protein [Sphingopyxis panaciterrulae]